MWSAGSRDAWSSAPAHSATAAFSAMPCPHEMQKKLNLKIKYREVFRPFAPSVLEEDVQEHFDLDRGLALHAYCRADSRRQEEHAASPATTRSRFTSACISCGPIYLRLRTLITPPAFKA